MSEPRVLVVYCTVPDQDTAESLSAGLVESGLAACVNIVPGITSIYVWRAALQRDGELMLVIKTDEDRLEALTERIGEDHPYDCPEVIALPVIGGAEEYLAWVREAGATPH